MEIEKRHFINFFVLVNLQHYLDYLFSNEPDISL